MSNRNNPNQRRKFNIRKHASKRLAALLWFNGSKCHWCGEPLVRYASIRRKYRITEQTSNYLTWIDKDGNTQKCRWATVDHLKRIADGGNNKNNNLVTACHSCNRGRHGKNSNESKYQIGQQTEPLELPSHETQGQNP